MGNTAPNSAHELCNTRCFVLPFACEATSGYGFGTRPVLKGSAKNEKQLEAIDPKAAPDGGSGWIGFGRLRDLTIGKVADQVVGDRKQVGFLQGNRDALEDRGQDTMASRNGQFLLFDALPFLCPLALDLLRRRRVGMVGTAGWIGINLEDLSALSAVHDDGLRHLVAWFLVRGELGSCAVRLGFPDF